MFATHSAAVTAICVDAIMLSRRLIALLPPHPPHSSHIKAITQLHARCLARPPGWFCNIVCLLLQIFIKAERQTGESLQSLCLCLGCSSLSQNLKTVMILCNELLIHYHNAVFEQILWEIFWCVSVRQRPLHRNAIWGPMPVLLVCQRLPTMCMKTATMRMIWQLEWRHRRTSDKGCTMSLTVRSFDHLERDQSMSPFCFVCVLWATEAGIYRHQEVFITFTRIKIIIISLFSKDVISELFILHYLWTWKTCVKLIAIVSVPGQEVKVIWQKVPHGGPIPRLGVTAGGRNLYHWIPGVGFPISVP